MPRKLLRDVYSFSTSYRRATCTVLSLLRRRHATTCLGFCFIYGTWTLITKKGRRLDGEIKRAQNAAFRILAMVMSVDCGVYYEKNAVGANALIQYAYNWWESRTGH